MSERMCESWSTNKQPLSDRAKSICKRLTDRAHQSDKLLDYDLLMTAVEVIEELYDLLMTAVVTVGEVEQALNGSGDGLTPDEPLNGNRGDAP